LFIVAPFGNAFEGHCSFFGIETFSRLEQPLNALLSMQVTESGIAIDVNLLQPSKADSPMEVTELGIAINLIHCSFGIQNLQFQ